MADFLQFVHAITTLTLGLIECKKNLAPGHENYFGFIGMDDIIPKMELIYLIFMSSSALTFLP